jgi:hypothetical protein
MTDGAERPGPEGPSRGDQEWGDARAADESGVGVPPGDEADRHAAPCEICGAPVIERHCKIVCLNCGYTRDCSDP